MYGKKGNQNIESILAPRFSILLVHCNPKRTSSIDSHFQNGSLSSEEVSGISSEIQRIARGLSFFYPLPSLL